MHDKDWRVVADEFFAEARNEKTAREDEEKQCLQARYRELLDAVVHTNSATTTMSDICSCLDSGVSDYHVEYYNIAS